jgi:hypothetical protein
MGEIVISEPRKDMLRAKVKERIEIEGKKPSIDKGKFIGGISIILKTFALRNVKTDSWGFPPLVVCTFLFLASGFLGASIFLVDKMGYKDNEWITYYVVVLSILQMLLWLNLSGKLYSLMFGSATVYSYYWKLIPLRALFLNKLKTPIKPTYFSLEEYLYNK